MAWPKRPYRGLDYYRSFEQFLYTERDIEIEACFRLLTRPNTQVLLLYGGSGVGKSSFLRAGLLPRVKGHKLDAGQRFVVPPNPGNDREPLSLRASSDPIRAIGTALIDGVVPWLHREADVLGVNRSMLGLATEFFNTSLSTSDLGASEHFLQGLEKMAGSVPFTLVLTFDQTEEIFTLRPKDDNGVAASAFFRLVEEICFREIDVRLVISIRSEFYGVFCDSLNIRPERTITARSGMREFMLKRFSDSAAIRRAIELPTSAQVMLDGRSPREIYGFEFDPGVAGTIADDLVEEYQNTFLLSMMQVLCDELYERVVHTGERRVITLKDYEAIGRVQGGLDGFIDRTLQAALNCAKVDASRSGVDAWKQLLFQLTAQSEGEIVVTLVESEEDLVSSACAKGLKSPAQVLQAMANEQWSLLRLASPNSGGARQDARSYSLGHDAIAVPLHIWGSTREKVWRDHAALQKRVKTLAVAASGFAIACLLFLAAIYYLSVAEQAQRVASLIDIADADGTPQFKDRLILYAAAVSDAASLPRFFPGAGELRHRSVSQLRTALARAPILGGSAEAAGISYEGLSLVTLESGHVTLFDLSTRKSGKSMGSFAYESQKDNAPWGFQIGFIDGMEAPVAYRGGWLYYQSAGKWTSIPVTGAQPDVLEKASTPPIVEISGGSIRFVSWSINPPKYQVALAFLRADFGGNDPFASSGPVDVSLPPAGIWPTNSPWSDCFAIIRVSESPSLFVGSLSTGGEGKRVGELSNYSFPGSAGYVRSIGFSPNDRAIAVRSSPTDIQVFPLHKALPPTASESYWLPEALQVTPRRSGFAAQRPVLAVAEAAKGWTFAWNDPRGIVAIGTTTESQLAYQIGAPVLLSGAAGLDGVRQLRFSSDGRFLILVTQTGFLAPVQYRVWHLGPSRMQELQELTPVELAAEGCKVAKIEGDIGAGIARGLVRKGTLESICG